LYIKNLGQILLVLTRITHIKNSTHIFVFIHGRIEQSKILGKAVLVTNSNKLLCKQKINIEENKMIKND
jgi:hypothetical protein